MGDFNSYSPIGRNPNIAAINSITKVVRLFNILFNILFRIRILPYKYVMKIKNVLISVNNNYILVSIVILVIISQFGCLDSI
jgi:hypothetical protein